jgi:hypothetical protein
MATSLKEPASRAVSRRVVKPDPIDLRDRLYAPSVRSRPPAELRPKRTIPVLDQDETSACTGFALATLIHWLSRVDGNGADRVSPFMLYSMARRYDEFAGSKKDSGSSLRGALKGWHKHGACRLEVWPDLDMPPVPQDPRDDWWGDAMVRPLGAYYRIEPTSIPDIHSALNEVGAVYASAVCHSGWDEGHGIKTKRGEYWKIPKQLVGPHDGGHAFVIVGYTHEGFIIHNSWGPGWGTGGHALLTYEDWRENAMDCWVAQMGVVTSLHLAIARSATLRTTGGRVDLADEERLRNHELAPYIVNMENNGKLSRSGNFRTKEGDVEALVTTYLERAREEWKLGKDDPIDIAIYAHGGLTSENDAAKTAAEWIPALYEKRIFPIFFMWETGLVETLANMFKDMIGEEPRRTAGMQRWWDERLERSLARPGTAIWQEMKENGTLISTSKEGGGRILYDHAMQGSAFNPRRDRVHLIGHSAGAIVHSELIETLAQLGWSFSTVNLMAPAATVEMFNGKVLPHIKTRKVARYAQWHLSDTLELKDTTCRAILGYGRSLLYLVSESFEGGTRTPLLGMEKYFETIHNEARNMRCFQATSPQTNSTTHGGFDNDDATRNSVIAHITRPIEGVSTARRTATRATRKTAPSRGRPEREQRVQLLAGEARQ